MKINEQAFQKGFIQECIDNKVDALMLKNAAEAMSRDMKKQAALGGLLRLGGQALRRYAPRLKKALPFIPAAYAFPAAIHQLHRLSKNSRKQNWIKEFIGNPAAADSPFTPEYQAQNPPPFNPAFGGMPNTGEPFN